MQRSIRLLQNRFVSAILLSNLLSQIGIWIRNLAILLYVMETTGGNVFAVTMISVAEYVPMFIFAFIGGAFADRWRPKRTIVCCEVLSALSVFAVLALVERGAWPAIFVATLCSSIVSQFAQPSGMKLFKLHVRDEDAPTCMALLQTLISVFMVAGPPLGTLAYRQWGIVPALWMTGAAFVLSALVLLRLPSDRVQAEEPRAALLRDMADGIRYVLRVKELLKLNVCFALAGLGVGLITPLTVFVATERLGLSPLHLPWLAVPYGAGEIIGGLAAFMLAAKVSPRRLLLAGLFVNGAGIVLTGLSAGLWLTMAAQFMLALFQPAIFIGNQALVMKHAGEAYIGRVTGIRTPLMTGSMLLAMSLSGVLKQSLSLPVAYGLAGLCFWAGMIAVPAESHSANYGT